MALELLHELLVERPEVDHLLLQRRGVGLLLLTVLPDDGAVPRGALLGGDVVVAGGVVVLRRRLGGLRLEKSRSPSSIAAAGALVCGRAGGRGAVKDTSIHLRT